MVNQTYLELINKDIDNNITEAEKELLDKYLKTNPEAYTLHQDLLESENMLDKLPDNNPSVTLKQRILNSIDFNRYADKRKRSLADYLNAAFTSSRKKLTVSFALGLVVGIIILSIVFYASYINNFPDGSSVYGTMGAPLSELLKSVEVNSLDISGKIEVRKAANQYGIYVDLKSSKKYTLQIELDQENLKVESQPDNSPYSLILPHKDPYPHTLLLKLMRDDRKLFEREIHLSNR